MTGTAAETYTTGATGEGSVAARQSKLEEWVGEGNDGTCMCVSMCVCDGYEGKKGIRNQRPIINAFKSREGKQEEQRGRTAVTSAARRRRVGEDAKAPDDAITGEQRMNGRR